ELKVRLAELNEYNLITRHLVSYFERRQDLIEYFREGCIFFVEGDLLASRNQLRMIKKSGVRLFLNSGQSRTYRGVLQLNANLAIQDALCFAVVGVCEAQEEACQQNLSERNLHNVRPSRYL